LPSLLVVGRVFFGYSILELATPTNISVRFPTWHQLVNEVLPIVVETTKEKYVLLAFASYITCTISFDLWMSHVGHDTFAMVVSFLNDFWEPSHVIMGIF
jgi:hypothetical protein